MTIICLENIVYNRCTWYTKTNYCATHQTWDPLPKQTNLICFVNGTLASFKIFESPPKIHILNSTGFLGKKIYFRSSSSFFLSLVHVYLSLLNIFTSLFFLTWPNSYLQAQSLIPPSSLLVSSNPPSQTPISCQDEMRIYIGT